MEKFKFYNQGQALIGIIIVLITVGLITGGLYYYFKTQIPEIPEMIEEIIKKETPIPPLPEEQEPISEPTTEEPGIPQAVLECTSGPCCDTSTNTFRPSTHRCQDKINTEYGCPWGAAPGEDVGARYQDRYCSGSSSECDGELSWSEWFYYDYCSPNETCVDAYCIPSTCSDGTSYDQCSTTQPRYCDNGSLINKCDACGCSDGQQCQTDGSCVVPTLSVSLSANPVSGNAPLDNVDLAAQVSGTATGTIDYKFDCTDNGSWDLEVNNSNLNPYIAVDLCDYSTADTYTAKIVVERGPLIVESRVTINVIAPLTYPIQVPVLALEYFPNQDGALRLDDSTIENGLFLCDGLESMPLQDAKDRVNLLNSLTLDALIQGSTYHGYKDSTAEPSLNYYVYETKIIEAEHPKTLVPGATLPYQPGNPPSYKTDYITMLNDINICDYVDNKGVKEVWVWAYCAQIAMWESNMAGPYGDISNSDRNPNDMPVCSKTYTLYHYNYGRGTNEALEDHGHQIESLLGYADYNLFWNIFVQPYGELQSTVNRCGNVHSPPNTKDGYDWYNLTDALSDCGDWKPEGLGETKIVNCHTWSDSPNCYSPDPLRDPLAGANGGFKVWWMQNIPGRNNNLSYQGKLLRNWWGWKGDFDQAMKLGKSLTY